MPKLPKKINLYRFHQVIYFIGNTLDDAKAMVNESSLPLAEQTPRMGTVYEEDEGFAPLFVDAEYAALFGDGERTISGNVETQLENINNFVEFITVATLTPSTFPLVPQFESSPSEFVKFLVTLAQTPLEVDANAKAYYFLRYPTLESKIKEWNLRRGFSAKFLE